MWRTCKTILSGLLPVLILLLFLAVLVCRLNQWDTIVPITIIPFWIWAVTGILLSTITWLLFRNFPAIFSLVVWAVAGLFYCEEVHGIWRELTYSFTSDDNVTRTGKIPETYRIVSIDCVDGNVEAARAAIDLKPDILFLQHAPLESELFPLAEEFFDLDASIVRSHRNAIVARGEFLTTSSDPSTPTVHARLRLPDATILDLTNVDLEDILPQPSRYFDEEYWDTMAATRKANRRRVRGFLADFDPLGKFPPRVVGGHFAVPVGDDIYRPLDRLGFRDAYLEAGIDGGNTYPTVAPLYRVDQIWISPRVEAKKTFTMKNPQSDHRMVVCDFVVKEEEKEE